MNDAKNNELTRAQLEAAAGGYQASQKRPMDQAGGLSQDELRRVNGAGTPGGSHQLDGGVDVKKQEQRSEAGGFYTGRTTLE